MKKTIIVSVIALLLVVGSVSALTLTVDELKNLLSGGQDRQIEESFGSLGVAPVDIVGTRIGSSTTGIAWYGAPTASTTYPSYIGRDIDLAVYDINFMTASSSGSNAYFSILTSQDDYCGTASTSGGDLNNYVVADVQWFDGGDYLKDKVHSTSLANTTSTMPILEISSGTHRQIILENINSQCLALEVNASATIMQIQLTTKQYN